MNIPEIYLVEPYNAYSGQKGPRKKHWHEIIEEQALMQRIVAEQLALQEASSRTLPPNSPDTSTPTVGNPSAGAGGLMPSRVFNPTNAVVGFSVNPSSGVGPLTVQFTNTTTNPELYTYLWTFGDGTTSTEANPSHVYQSGSSATNNYTASLRATSSLFGTPARSSSLLYISASKPSVTALFTRTTSSNTAPSVATFVNITAYTGSGTLIYRWEFGSGSLTSSVASPTPVSYSVAGPYTASLQVTESTYNITSNYTQSWRLA